MMDVNGQAPLVPVLGQAIESKKKKGFYVVKEKAAIGKLYRVACPVCQSQLLVKAREEKPWIERCKTCKTTIALQGKAAACSHDDGKPQAEPAVSVPTEKVRIQVGKEVYASGKLEWGGFFRHKSYLLHEGKNYVGRNDSEIPSDVNIDDEYVSRRSILIEVAQAPKGYTYKLTVQKCTNPVLINGREQAVGNSIYLNYGDTILVGNTTLTFKSAK